MLVGLTCKTHHISFRQKSIPFKKKLPVTNIGIIFGSRICFLHISAPDRNRGFSLSFLCERKMPLESKKQEGESELEIANVTFGSSIHLLIIRQVLHSDLAEGPIWVTFSGLKTMTSILGIKRSL